MLRGRSARSTVLAAVSICALVPVVLGMGKSLWLDEAWVANSVLSANLQQVFFYDSWLQTSPPLFLLLARWTVQLLGPANWVFRLVPFAAGIAAAVVWWALVRRLFSRWQAIFVWTLFVLNATAVTYAREMKPFSSDLAASTAVLLTFVLYLERPAKERLWLLVAAAGTGLLLSYTVIFLIPGILVGVWMRSGLRCSVPVAAIAVVLFAAEYHFLIVPNSSSDLVRFWTTETRGQSLAVATFIDALRLLDSVRLPVPVPLLTRPRLLIGTAGVWLALSFWVGRRRREAHRWVPILVVCAITCLLSLLADMLALYPISYRTSLFLLPSLLLVLAAGFELILPVAAAALRRARVVTCWNLAMICATCAIATVFIRAQWIVPFGQPDEDTQGAVSFLKPLVEQGDALWVHATASEGFKLYSQIPQWKPDGLIARGDTAWPCCRRHPSVTGGVDAGVAISSDMDAKLPAHLPGRLWFLYSSRSIEFQKAQRELRLARLYLADRGCRESPGRSFVGIAVLLFECGEGGRVQ
jgi:4-amino-4-deoxy-L-arabinose transferase-like glycosyltransferase